MVTRPTAAGLGGAVWRRAKGKSQELQQQQKSWNNRKHPPPHLPCRQEASGPFLEQIPADFLCRARSCDLRVQRQSHCPHCSVLLSGLSVSLYSSLQL